jgi:hypothetical protein
MRKYTAPNVRIPVFNLLETAPNASSFPDSDPISSAQTDRHGVARENRSLHLLPKATTPLYGQSQYTKQDAC